MSAFVSCIKRDEDGKHQRKTEQGGAAVTQERERNADNRHYAYGHAYVYEKVHEKTAGYAVAVYAREGIRAFFRPGNDSANQQHVKRDDRAMAIIDWVTLYPIPVGSSSIPSRTSILFR